MADPVELSSYTLLAASGCDEPLPAANVVDSYAYHRFVPLWVHRDDGDGPAGIGGEHLVPGHKYFMEKMAKRVFPPDEVKVPFGVDDLFKPTAQLHEVAIDDVDETVLAGEVTIGGQRRVLPADRDWIAALLDGRDALVQLDPGEFVRLRVAEAAAAVPDRVAVTDLAELLATRSATATSAPIAAALSRDHLVELRTSGRTTVEVAGRRVLVEQVSAQASASTATSAPPTKAMEIRPVGTGPGPGQIAYEAALPFIETDVRFALHLSYVQEWELLGYARGELLNSVALTAGEQVTVELRSWDRTTSVTERATAVERESLVEVQTTARRSANVLTEVTRANDWRMTVGGSVSLPVSPPVSVGANLSYETGGSVERVNANTLDLVDEAVWRASNRVKTVEQTKVVVTREVGSESRVTKVLRNANDTRTLTYDFFEVLASYRVGMRPEGVRLAALVPNPIPAPVDRHGLLVHEGPLRTALLDPVYASGFDAARLLAAQDRYCGFACGLDCGCQPAPNTGGEGGGSSTAGAGAAGGSTATTTSPVDAAAARVVAAGERIATAIETIRNAGHAALSSAYDNKRPREEKDAAIVQFRQWLYREFGLEIFSSGFWTHCLRFVDRWSGDRTPERVESVLGGADRAWLETTLKAITVAALYQLAVPFFAAKFAIEFRFKALWFASFATAFDDAGLRDALSGARREVDTWRKALENAADTVGAAPSPAEQPSAAPPPPAVVDMAGEMERPWPAVDLAQAAVAEKVLLDHITANRGHYQAAIWAAMDPVDRAAQLQLYGPLGEYVSNEVLGFVGDRIALPFHVGMVEGLREVVDQIATQSLDNVDPVSRDVVLPTPGVHVQSRLGECDTCEPYVTEIRALDVAEREARVNLARAEAQRVKLDNQRRKLRLEQDPPVLDADPIAGALRLDLDGGA